MQRTFTLLLLTTTLVLGALSFFQWRALQERNTTLGVMRADLEARSETAAEQEKARAGFDSLRQQLERQVDGLTARVQSLQARLGQYEKAAVAPPSETAPGNGGAAGFGTFMSKLMDDPDMKHMIREQQKGMLDSLYGPLFKEMGLSEAETGQFKDLLAENQAKATERGMAFLNSTNRSELVQTIAEEHKQGEAQIRQFLGEERYAKYQDYQGSLGERSTLNQFRLTNATLTDEQNQSLLAIMKQERAQAGVPGSQPAYGTAGTGPAGGQMVMSDEQQKQILEAQEAANQRILDRAQSVLTPEQWADFGRFQGNQLKMMRMGLNMSKQLLVPDLKPGP